MIYGDHPSQIQELEKSPSHPSSLKFPTVQIFPDDSTKNIVMSETAAIADYLSHQLNTRGISQLSRQEIQFYYYLKNFAEATFMPDLALKQFFAQIVARTPFPLSIYQQIPKVWLRSWLFK